MTTPIRQTTPGGDLPAFVVEMTTGDRGPEPSRFGQPGAFCQVDEIVDRWPGDGYSYFKLRSHDALYVLRHDERNDSWQVQFFQDELRDTDTDADSPLFHTSYR